MGVHVPHYPEPPSYLPPHPIPLGCPRAPALSSLLHSLNWHWSSILHMAFFFSPMSRDISLFFKIIYFDWRLITLQYCGGFCHTLT